MRTIHRRDLTILWKPARKFAFALALLALISSPLPQSANSQSEYSVKGKPVSKETYQAAVLVSEALPLINSQRYQEAINKLESALKLAPTLPEAHYNLSVALIKTGKPVEAIPHLQAVVESGAELPQAWVSLASIRQNSGKLEEAATLYKEAFQKFPPKTWDAVPEIHYNYGLALGKLGQSDAAIEELNLALPAKAGMPGLWLTLGAIYQSSGKIQESINAYGEFLSRFPKDREAPRVRAAIQTMEREAKADKRSRATDSSDDYYAETTVNGPRRWRASEMPIRIYVKPGAGVPGFKPYYDDLLKQSAQEWVDASDGNVSVEYVTSPSKAQINFWWSDNPADVSNRAEGGEAKIYVREDGTIASGKIVVLTIPITPLRPITDNLVRFVCLHEIGHVLGISGHSTKPNDVMFFSTSVTDDRKELSSRDKKTLSRLYSQKR
jgi:tetratricopeptide (TPR) repeat protein